MRHKVKPLMAGIEKKSTGVTLISTLQGMQGLRIIDVERTRKSGSKTDRFIEIQPIIAAKLISLPLNGSHTRMCVTHMGKITANDSHRNDDIADTLHDGIMLGLIDKVVPRGTLIKTQEDDIVDQMMQNHNKLDNAIRSALWRQ